MKVFRRTMKYVALSSVSLAAWGCVVDVEDSASDTTVEDEATLAETQQALTTSQCGTGSTCATGYYHSATVYKSSCPGVGWGSTNPNAIQCTSLPPSGNYIQCRTGSTCASGYYHSATVYKSSCPDVGLGFSPNARQCAPF